jgi:hypothetical protein
VTSLEREHHSETPAQRFAGSRGEVTMLSEMESEIGSIAAIDVVDGARSQQRSAIG